MRQLFAESIAQFCKHKLGVTIWEALAISLTYWVQGVLSLSDLATSFYFKDLLHASPAELAVAQSIAYTPWTLKPLYGFCSDTIPIAGRKRRPYLLLAALVATACFGLLSVMPASAGGAVLLSTVLAMAIALSDVVVDGIVVERSRNQPQEVAGSLQSICWGSRYTGAIVTSWFGGTLVDTHGPRAAFAVSAMFPLSVALAALCVQETPVDTLTPTWTNLWVLFRMQCWDLWTAMKQPSVRKPTMFLVLANALPTAGAAMFFFFTEHLGFSAGFMGHMQTFGYVAAIGGIAAYNAWCKRIPLRQLLAVLTLVSVAVELSRLLLITGVNRLLHISDGAFAILDNSLLRCLGELAQMPLLVLAARLCPPGLEATLFAALMSLLNGAGALGELLGGALTALLGVTAEHVDNLWLLLVLTSSSMLLTLPLLRFLPHDLDSLGRVGGGVGGQSHTSNDGGSTDGRGEEEEEEVRVPLVEMGEAVVSKRAHG